MCANFLGFLWDSAAHNFELHCLAWLEDRDHRVRLGCAAKHVYQKLEPWTW